ncbi:MAG: hypothetical protein JXM70_18480 [Pirellulales bacterium]|nr:hypothetical protein [Pirellulales bacterium]
MRQLVIGCGVPILLFAVFFGGYAYFFLARIEPVWLAYVLAGVCALMLCLAIGAVKTFFQTGATARALHRARHMLVPGEGELTAVHGEVVAVGETINTPFSNRPCVSYEYEIYRNTSTGTDGCLACDDRTSDETSKEQYAFGLAKTEYVIRTSTGDVRPLGYPSLDHSTKGSCHFSEHFLEGPYGRQLIERLGITEAELPEVKQRAESYLRDEYFHEASGLGMVTALVELAEAIEEDTGFVRKDWKVHDPESLDDATLVETLLEVGQEVCALGKWDATRSGLYPPVVLIAGDYDNAKRILIAGKRSSAVFGLIFAILFSAILIAFAWFSGPVGP